jgi:hypothetical protein
MKNILKQYKYYTSAVLVIAFLTSVVIQGAQFNRECSTWYYDSCQGL